jgi:radical SAM protein with 4Fe4S-binding SPASM domain
LVNSDAAENDSDNEKSEISRFQKLKRISAICKTPNCLSLGLPIPVNIRPDSSDEDITIEMNPCIWDFENEIANHKYKIYLDKYPRFSLNTKWSVVEDRMYRQEKCKFCKIEGLCMDLCPRRWVINGINYHPVMLVLPVYIFDIYEGSSSRMIFSDDPGFLDFVQATKGVLELGFGKVSDFLILDRKVNDSSGNKLMPDREWLSRCRSIDNPALMPKIWLESVKTIREYKIRQKLINN